MEKGRRRSIVHLSIIATVINFSPLRKIEVEHRNTTVRTTLSTGTMTNTSFKSCSRKPTKEEGLPTSLVSSPLLKPSACQKIRFVANRQAKLNKIILFFSTKIKSVRAQIECIAVLRSKLTGFLSIFFFYSFPILAALHFEISFQLRWFHLVLFFYFRPPGMLHTMSRSYTFSPS